MKIEKLNENKLKITLDKNDLKSRNIDARSFIYNTPESQDLFWEAMQEAEKKYDFQVEESMIYVEAHMSQNGIFTLIVTKNQNGTNKKSRIINKGIKLKRKEVPQDLSSKLFRFSNIASLCNFCEIADSSGYGKTSLYMLNNNYYLYISAYSGNSILEFADLESNQEKTMAKISEYGKVLYKNNAIKTIQNYLSK